MPNVTRIELRTALPPSTVLIGLTYWAGTRLRDTVMIGDSIAFDSLVWTLATLFLGAMSSSAILATLGIGINTLHGQPIGFWRRTSEAMYDLCIWLLYWAGLWGFPFVLAMILFSETREYLGPFVALILACLVAVPLLFISRILPAALMNHLRSLTPYMRYGLLPGTALILFFFFVGAMCCAEFYLFKVELQNPEIRAGSTSRIDLAVSGRILNLKELRAQIDPISSTSDILRPVVLFESEPGKFTGWINAEGLPPGRYRLSVYFQNYLQASLITRLPLRLLANNHQRRTLVFRVVNGQPPPRF
jgi:hypothetical protein